MSERQSKEHARKAKDKMKEIQELMQQHRNGCDICQGVVVLQSASLGVER
jgi:epoxyqueuosine reductase QueG